MDMNVLTEAKKEDKHMILNLSINQLAGLKRSLEKLLSRINSNPIEAYDKNSEAPNMSLLETLDTGAIRIDSYRDSTYKLIEEIETALF